MTEKFRLFVIIVSVICQRIAVNKETLNTIENTIKNIC